MQEIKTIKNSALVYWQNKLQNHTGNSFFNYVGTAKDGDGQRQEIKTDFPQTNSANLLKTAKGKDFNIYKLGLTALSILLGKYTGRSDLLLCSTALQLDGLQVKSNAMVFPSVAFDSDSNSRTLLKQIHQELEENIAHQEYEFASLEQDFLHGKSHYSQAFNIGFYYEPINQSQEAINQCDVLFWLSRKEEVFSLTLRYNEQKYSATEIQLLSKHFLNLLDLVVGHLDLPIAQLNFIDAYDQELVDAFNATETDFIETSVIRQFEDQAARRPDALCIKSEAAELTYAEVNKKGNQIAHHLLTQCSLQKGEKISLMVNRSELIITGIVGVLKAGGLYIPIDLSAPKERIQFFLEDSGSRIVLTEKALIADLEDNEAVTYIAIDDLQNDQEENLEVALKHRDLAYMIYTSGTTGNPKGAMIFHRSLANHVSWFRKQFELTETDSTMLINSYSFDGCYSYIWATLTAGGVLHIPKDKFFDPEKVLRYIKQEKVTFLKLVPSTFGVLVNSEAFDRDPTACQSIRIIKQGGESINVTNLKKYLKHYPHVVLGNHYGATECTIGSVAHWVDKDSIFEFEKRPVVGSPFDNQHVLILDAQAAMLPVGVAGEICIGGVGVGNGYHCRPELTAKKFIDHPFLADQKIYRTGDKGRWLPNGTIEFHGRIDNQVKIRGYRIELDGISETLKQHEAIIDSTVLVYNDEGEDQLAAYLVFDEVVEVEALQNFLKEKLPPYMMPALYVSIDRIPLTPNGKIDRRALPNPKEHQLKRKATMVAPTNPTEAKLVEMWQDLLSLEAVGIEDNFFEMGGHSLRATQLVALIHQEFNVKVPLREVFFKPTIAEIAQLIESSEEQRFTTIKPAEPQELYPLSHAQQRLWILSKMTKDFTAYNIPHIVKLHGPLNVEAFEKAINALIERHEILRTVFVERDQLPFQKILSSEAFDFQWTVTDLRGEADQMKEASNLFNSECQTVFDLENGPLLKARLVLLGEEEYLFLFTLHHIISDGSSNNVFVKDILNLYESFQAGGENPLEPLNIQYKDYAVWQNEMLRSETAQTHKNYWLDSFSGELPVLNMPLDFERPKIMNFEGDAQSLMLDKATTKRLNAFAAQNNTSLFMIFLATVKSLLFHYTRQEDIIIGSPIAGREHANLKDQIGFYVNTLAVRTQFDRTWSFEKMLQVIKNNLLDAYEHQVYPFDQLIDDLQLERNTNRSPLFDVLVVMQNSEEEGEEYFEKNQLVLGSLEEIEADHNTSKFDLAFSFSEQKEGLNISLEYRTDLFLASRINRMLQHLANIIEQVLEDPSQNIHDFNLLTHHEWQQVENFSGSVVPVEETLTVHRVFQKQVALYPDRVALADKEKSYTYREVDQLSSALAYQLKEKYQVQAEDAVAVVMGKSTDFILAMLAILKAGAAYLPIESKTPVSRILQLTRHTESKLALTDTAAMMEDLSEKISCLDFNTLIGQAQASEQVYEHEGTCHDLAYIMYTSGSTGEPKGAMIEHKSILRLVKDTNFIEFSEKDVILQTGALSFDAATIEIWGPLLNGGSVFLLELMDLLDANSLKQSIVEHKVSVMWFTVSWFNHLAEQDPTLFQPLRHLLFGGEKASPKHVQLVQQACPELIMTNGYGPTENTTFSSCKRVDAAFDGKSLSIGFPISNSSVYILDAAMNPVPVGVQGEIYLGGEGLSRGYINNEKLTSEVFVDHPFVAGGRLYKSGDLGYWRENGEIEISGRVDDQLKIRGFRIEPGEVVSAMENHPEVRQAVVITHSKENGDKILAAYFTADQPIQGNEMKFYLGKMLPSYMLPASILQIPLIPLNKNGKLDRSALPQPQILLGEYLAPANEIEERLSEIWAELLEIPASSISTLANFFELGGHSLKATVLLGHIKMGWNIDITLAQIFATPSIKGLAEYIANSQSTKRYAPIIPQEIIRDNYLLSPPQNRIFILQHFNRESTTYNMPFVFFLDEKYTPERIKKAMTQLVQRHDSLRTSFHLKDDQPVQVIHDEVDFEVEIFEESSLEAAMDKFVRPFDLAEGPLFRMGYNKNAEGEIALLMDIHHIISDNASQKLLEKEMEALLEEQELPEVGVQFRDYIDWYYEEEQQKELEEQERFWQSVFAESIPLLDLPLDFARPELQSFEGASAKFYLTGEEAQIIQQLATQSGSTHYLVLLSLWKVLLSKLSNLEDITIGTPVSGRNHPSVEQTVGMFVNTLALRSYPQANKTFADFLQEVKNTFVRAFENQNYPFENLVEKIWDNNIKDRNPIFDTMFGLLNDHENAELPTSQDFEELISFNTKNGVAKFDLSLMAIDCSEFFEMNLNYCTRLFKRETIEQFIHYFRRLVLSLKAGKDTCLIDLEILSEQEQEQLLLNFNQTESDYPKDQSIVDLWRAQCAKSPQSPALAFNGESWTYQELEERSNQLAHHLMEQGLLPGSRVSLCLEHSAEMVQTVLAIIKIGASYVPIDPKYPQERIHYIVEDIESALLITSEKYRDNFEAIDTPLILLESINVSSAETPTTAPDISLQSKDPIYIIYTSGSTGNPKGVVVRHRNLVNYLTFARSHYGVGVEVFNVPLFTSLSFDLTQTSLFLPLLSGGCLYVEANEDIYQTIQNILKNDTINAIKLTPSHAELMEDCTQVNLACAILGGEELLPHHVEKLKGINPDMAVFNEYGPTETTVGCTVYEVKDTESPILIGKAIANTQIYITGKTQRIAPIGVIGEICIGGDGVAIGYWNRPGLTAKKFTLNPFQSSPSDIQVGEESTRIYKTGDWGRWLPDGNIEFLGRIDEQVKINGYRIELGEIEAVMQQSPLVSQCTLMVREGLGAKQLLAYVVPESIFDKERIQAFLQSKLPSYMVPSIFVELEEMPLSTNGKIDKSALPEPTAALMANEYHAPKNAIERKLDEIWRELLYIDKISTNDNFFDLGGHSILSMRMIGKIKEHFEISLSIRDLMEHPTIEKLSSYLSNEINAKSLIFPLNKIVADQPLIFMVPPILGSSVIFYPLAGLFEKRNISCYGFQYRGFDHDEDFDESIEQMAQSFFKEIQLLLGDDKSQTLNILGYSMGVTIAFELVQLLEEAGYQCKMILLDKGVSPKRLFGWNTIRQLTQRKKDLQKLIKLHLGDRKLDLAPKEEARINSLLLHSNKILNRYITKEETKVKASILAIEAEKSTAKGQMRAWEAHTEGRLIHRYIISNHYELLDSDYTPDILDWTTQFIDNVDALPGGKPKAKMTLFSLFHNRSAFFFPFLGFLGIINGIWGSALLLLINNKISNVALPYFDQYDWVIYIGLIIVSFSVAAYFQAYMIRLTFNFGNELGLSIFNKLRFAKYEDFVKLGEERVRTALEDVAVLQSFPNTFIEGFNAAIMVTVGIGYLYWIYATGATFVLVSLVVLAAIYIFRNVQIEKDLNEARDLGNIYHKNVVDFLRGFKELKMNITRSDNIFTKFLTKNRNNFVRLQIKSITRALSNELMGIYAWYIMIGIVLFLLPAVFVLSIEVRTSFLVTLLFLMGPINAVIGLMDEFIRMRIALNRLGKFDELVNLSMTISDGHGDLTEINENFESIRFENVTYEYFDKNRASTFRLKPINLEIKKGEIIFVTGGNGSGKSTFINILAGLYAPKRGQIYLNDHLITSENVAYYRDQLSCIFTDNYLFTDNYDELDLRRSNKTFYALLQKMKLTQAITFDNDNNKIMHTLSKGQQKRIALIYSILHENDVFIFDEWAAEQDPDFRKFFYTSIVPELKEMGKTVIAVTHDDVYFNCAERILKFDYGEIILDEKVTATPLQLK